MNSPARTAAGFAYRDGALHAESVPLAHIAEAVGTPFYCYSSALIEARYREFAGAFADQRAQVFYAIKANSNLAVIRLFARLGAGADIVSEGELRRALAAGVPAERIVFSGVGKTAEEMAFALGCGIHQINVESEPELTLLDEVARGMGMRANAVRYGARSVNCEPIWTASPLSAIPGITAPRLASARILARSMPNLFSFLPVEILA